MLYWKIYVFYQEKCILKNEFLALFYHVNDTSFVKGSWRVLEIHSFNTLWCVSVCCD